MIDVIKTYYHEKRSEMNLKRKWKDLLNKLSIHLLEFASEGRKWIQKRSSTDSVEYLHQVNVKCGWANYLNNEVVKIQASIIVDVSNRDKYTSDIDSLKKVLTNIHSLIITSLNVVPYSKMDEFNLLVYDIQSYISTSCYE